MAHVESSTETTYQGREDAVLDALYARLRPLVIHHGREDIAEKAHLYESCAGLAMYVGGGDGSMEGLYAELTALCGAGPDTDAALLKDLAGAHAEALGAIARECVLFRQLRRAGSC